MYFIGDVHGKFQRYKSLIKTQIRTIQVGDMGVGFRKLQGPRAGAFTQNPPHYAMLAGGHRFIRGNHDNPSACKNHSQYIEDGTVEDGMMFIGGGYSIDRAWRIEDYTWWKDEELSIEELQNIRTVYLNEKPRVMVTHECPIEIGSIILQNIGLGSSEKLKSRTADAFQHMFSGHSPKLWVFGHHHRSFDFIVNNTRFVCLAELEMKDLDIG